MEKSWVQKGYEAKRLLNNSLGLRSVEEQRRIELENMARREYNQGAFSRFRKYIQLSRG